MIIIHQKIKKRINTTGAKIVDKAGLYDFDDNLFKEYLQTKKISFMSL